MSNVRRQFSPADRSIQRLYIFGAGGSGREVAWLAEQSWGREVELVFLVDRPEYVCAPVNGIPVQMLSNVPVNCGFRFVIAIGDSILRRSAARACIDRGLLPVSLIHPRAEISPWVSFGDGVVVCAGAVLTTNVVIGQHSHINVSCTISHDVSIGEFATLSPGAHISGHVSIGRDVFIGTGASIINGHMSEPLVIGDGAVIAAGACVTKSVKPGVLMAGVPAIRKR